MAKIESTVQEVMSYFGDKKIISRPDIATFEKQTGKRVHQNVWLCKASRGVYDISNIENPPTHVAIVQEKVQIEKIPEQPIKKETVSREIDVFVRDGQIPQVDPLYVPWGHYNDIEKLVKSNHFFTLYITGESGTGKNAMIEQVCAQNNRPMVRVNMTRDTTEDQIIGAKTLIDGNIVYEDGPLVWAATNGAILILDEISTSDANTIMCLQAALEGKSFFVKSLNKMIDPKPGFAIVATDNTKGQGSDSGKWIGTNVLNSAFLDRFDMMIEQEYPPTKIELQIFQKTYEFYNKSVDIQFCKDLCDWVQIIRRTYQQDAIEDLISTRRALRIIKAKALWFNADKAIEFGVTRFDETTSDAFKVIWSKVKTGELKNAE